MDEKYTEVEMKESVLYRKTRAQQEAALKKFHNLPVKTEDLLSIDLNESNSESNEITTTPLSVPLENCGIIRVPFSILATGREHHGGRQLFVTALMLPPIPVPSPNFNLKCRTK